MEHSAIFKPLLSTTHAPIVAHFSKNASDFVVREKQLYEFSGDGEHLIIEIQKKGLTTNEAINMLSSFTGCKKRDFGYAGLKDKEGMTTQFLSLPARFEERLVQFSADNLKILQMTKHENKIRVGHLKSNSFFIRLKKVRPSEATRLSQALDKVNNSGYPNYFGYQRFGRTGANAATGERILSEELSGQKSRSADKQINDFLMISAYQSDLFNRWLSKRVELSRFVSDFSEREIAQIYGFESDIIKDIKSQKQFFKLLKGDVMGHYPFGKLFLCEDLASEVSKFVARDRTACGLLIGDMNIEASGIARSIEESVFKDVYKFSAVLNGARRFAWAWIEDLKYRFDEETAQFYMNFSLQKGAYATVVLREILGRDIFDE